MQPLRGVDLSAYVGEGVEAKFHRRFLSGRVRYARVSPSPQESSSAIGTWLRTSFKDLVRFRRHDEVVSVQTTDLVRPPGDCYLAPLGQQRRVVALLLGLPAYSVGESKRLGEVTEPELALQAFDAFPLHYLPLG